MFVTKTMREYINARADARNAYISEVVRDLIAKGIAADAAGVTLGELDAIGRKEAGIVWV